MSVINTNLASGILTVTISRPQALNALNSEVMTSLSTVMRTIYTDPEIKGVILTGDGEKAFVAGADIKELAALDAKGTLELAIKGQKLFKSIEDCLKPIVAAVNGFALGGGCELAMACHMRIATENAKFGQPEVNLGIIPGYGGTQRLTQLVGRGKALELLLTADIITAQEAKNLGLVNHVVADKTELIAMCTKILQKIMTKGSLAIANTIRAVNAGFNFEDSGYQAEAKYFSECSTTEDFKEGTSAFLEKRAANFKGR